MKYLIYIFVIYMIYRFLSQSSIKHTHHVYHHAPPKSKKPEVTLSGKTPETRTDRSGAGEYVDFEEIKD